MTDTDMLYMAAQEKRLTELESENRELKKMLKAAVNELNNGTCTKFCSTCTKVETHECQDYKTIQYIWNRTDEAMKLLGGGDNG